MSGKHIIADLSEAQRRALEIIRNNPRIEGGGQFYRKMWPDSTSNSYGAANFLLGRLADQGLVARSHKCSGSSGDKGRNVYWLTDNGRAALAKISKDLE